MHFQTPKWFHYLLTDNNRFDVFIVGFYYHLQIILIFCLEGLENIPEMFVKFV